MEKRRLGQTDLEVSSLCLGTMTWGEQNVASDAFAQLDLATTYGVNFIDTAEMYPVPPKAETQGATERILGQWLAQRGGADDLVIATKVAGPADWLPWLRSGPQLQRDHIEAALAGSLDRLGVDCVDLYQIHWPARATNYFGKLGFQVPAASPDQADAEAIHALLEVMQGLIRDGRVRYIGLSNETPWGTMRFLAAADTHDLPRVVSIQNPYNLLNRSFETGLAEIAWREHCGLLAYSPLAFGVLSGKYLGGKRPAGARLTEFTRFTRYLGAHAEAAVQAYREVADRHGLSLAQLALAFVTGQGFVTSNIIGATSIEQLQENLDSAAVALGKEVLAELDQVHAIYTYPCP